MISSKLLIQLVLSTFLFSWTSSTNLYPFLVTIFHEETPICGGIVIHKTYILTAASCVHPSSQDYYVLFGDPKSVRRIVVDEVLYAPSYIVKCQQNDLAILRLVDALPLKDEEMSVKRISLKQEVDFVECFIIYMTKNLEQIASPAIWLNESVRAPNPKYNDFSLEIVHYLDNVTSIFPLKGSPLICNGNAVGLFSMPWKSPKSGRVLGLFTQILMHLHWIERYAENVTSDDPLETNKPCKPDGIEPSTTLSPVIADEPNGDKRLQSHLLVLAFIGLARILSSMK